VRCGCVSDNYRNGVDAPPGYQVPEVHQDVWHWQSNLVVKAQAAWSAVQPLMKAISLACPMVSTAGEHTVVPELKAKPDGSANVLIMYAVTFGPQTVVYSAGQWSPPQLLYAVSVTFFAALTSALGLLGTVQKDTRRLRLTAIGVAVTVGIGSAGCLMSAAT